MLYSPFLNYKVISKVSPISKTTNPTESSDYRPISVLQALPKVYKRLILLQLTEYIEKHHPLKKTGDRNDYSINKVEMKFTNEILKAMN